MKKRIVSITVIIVCIFAVIVAVFGYRMIQQKQQVRDLLELGNQYLQEEQYEEAIVAYKQLLAIEPKEETARENIVVAAVAWSDDLIEVKEYDKAEEVIADVYSIVPDERLESMRQEIIDERETYEKELLEIKKKEEERKQAVEQINADLSELAQICASGDDDAVFSYLTSDAFQTLIQSEYIEFDKKYETEFGMLGLYKDGYCLYFGDYDGDIRSGTGAWYGIADADSYRYVARGEWKNDKPNGSHREFTRNDTGAAGTIMEGNVIDGLWDGIVMHIIDDHSEQTIDFPVTFHMGRVVVLRTDDKGAIVSEISEDRRGQILTYSSPDLLRGIRGFCE